MCFCVCFKELTEEGIPFLILFHQKDDTESLEKFQQEVARQLISEKGMDGPVRIISHNSLVIFCENCCFESKIGHLCGSEFFSKNRTYSQVGLNDSLPTE